MWTSGYRAAGTEGALKQQKKKQVERNKVVALITMEILNRDVIERMVKAHCNSVSDFEWLSQLRFVFIKKTGEFGTW